MSATEAALPDTQLRALVRGFAQLYLEVESGLRPRRAVEPLLEPRLRAVLADHWVRRGPLRRPGSVRLERCGPDCVEAAIVVRGPQRAGALCVRLERREGRWQVTAAARPEDGVLPEPEHAPPMGELCAFELVLPPRERHLLAVADVRDEADADAALPAAVGL